jgi:chaperonin GroES
MVLFKTIKKERKMNIKPLRDKILVRPESEEEKTKSGIILPDTAKEKPQRGKVVAVGSGRIDDGDIIPLEVKEGDIVIYEKYGPSEIKINNEDLLIIKEDDILAVVTE